MLYTKEEILKAAEIGEVSMIDAEHIVSLLFDARLALLGSNDEVVQCMGCEDVIKSKESVIYCANCYGYTPDL